MNSHRIHGILSLVILAAAVLAAAWAIVQSSILWAVLFLIGILLSGLVVVWSFCAKCPCREKNCGHIIPGWLTRFFPQREEGPYTFQDKTGIVVPLVFVIVFPQYWLLAVPALSVLFAALLLIAAADIQFFVCRGCTNCFCPFFQESGGRGM